MYNVLTLQAVTDKGKGKVKERGHFLFQMSPFSPIQNKAQLHAQFSS